MVTVRQEGMASGGGRVGSGNPMSATIVLGQPIGGSTASGTFLFRIGPHRLTASVRDEDGGSRTQDINAFVARQPVPHP